MTDFSTWTQENLAKFAKEATVRMEQQQEYNEHLLLDLKGAIDAYRDLLRLTSVEQCSIAEKVKADRRGKVVN
jgi:DNA polymerase III delta prime subunit